MTERKPPGERVETFVERQIREAQERGEFDDLPGYGKPLPNLDRPYDELWWVRKKLKEEDLSYLPPALQVRRDIEEARGRIDRARTEREVRQIVGELNEQIRAMNRTNRDGPLTAVSPLDEQQVVDDWHARRDTP